MIQQIEKKCYSNIIFDFDETIARLMIDWSYFHIYMKELAEEYGVEKQREEMNTDGFTRFFIEKYWDEGKQKIEAIFEKTESEHYSGLEVNEILVDFIRKNATKYRFYILSNNMYATLMTALWELDLKDAFVQVFGRNSVPRPKPYPDGIHQIIEWESLVRDDFVMIGDNPNSDIAAANNAGIDSILINMYV